MGTRRFRGYYKPLIGETQKGAVELYYFELHKTVDEMQELLHCPRASIRGRISELKKERGLL